MSRSRVSTVCPFLTTSTYAVPRSFVEKTSQLNAIAGAIDGALRAQQNLVRALRAVRAARSSTRDCLPRRCASTCSVRVSGAGLHADHGNSARVGGHGLLGISRGADLHVRRRRRCRRHTTPARRPGSPGSGTSVPPSGTAVTISGDSLTVIGSPRVSAWPAPNPSPWPRSARAPRPGSAAVPRSSRAA